MSFPIFTPSSRQFGSGDFPVSKYEAADGVEIRILRGNLRTGATLSLVYNALSDAETDLFITHYEAQKGSFLSFTISPGALKGYEGNSASINAGTGNEWRYASPIGIQSLYPGVSTVTVSLVGVL